jgi:phosphoribosylformylglycinamidine synthase subunit PurL
MDKNLSDKANSKLTNEIKEKLSKYRLNESEYQKINDLLGREPEGVEWALFSALWSEHCSYKSSRRHLKNFFSESDRLVSGFGENAGVIDLGLGERVGFKMESHNHPSFIEPYQGAATGVGGILRDIFTMGARPIALANYLCFGKPEAKRMQTLVQGVVHGISGYGNCVGVPNISGQTEFHDSYDENILVNAFALGYFGEKDVLVTSQAKGLGNWVVYVGAKTGRDGIHGASMASESFEDGSESKRPTIQIGDPFLEKLLIESCIEVINQDLVVAIQDMGAAGLTSSSFEMASKGGVGFDLYLDEVPLRDSTMTPEDILLSESQERMLLVCEPKQFEAIQKVFTRWNLEATKIGEVIKERVVNLHWHGEVICSIDPDTLTENAPNYDRAYSKDFKNMDHLLLHKKDSSEIKSAAKIDQSYIDKIYSSLILAPKNWIYDQYDQRVGAKTAKDCSEPVGVIVLPQSKRSLGIVLGCRPYIMRMSAYLGAQDAIFYPAIELALKGLEPLAVTDCLNFGNPEKQNVMTDFVATVEGMSEACRSLKTPVISGNVSFYNETRGQNITSTPSTGLVGLGGSPDKLPKTNLEKSGDLVYLVSSKNCVEISGKWSEINQMNVNLNSKAVSNSTSSSASDNVSAVINQPWVSGALDVQNTADYISALLKIVDSGLVKSSRIVGAFGLFPTLVKMSSSTIGVDLEVTKEDAFKEKLYESVLVISEKDKSAFEKTLASFEKALTYKKVGIVNSSGEMNFKNEKTLASQSVQVLKAKSKNTWAKAFPELK